MRSFTALALAIAACSSPSGGKPQPVTPATGEPAPVDTPAPAPAPPAAKPLAADTPSTTTQGNAFIAPIGWSLAVRGDATILAAPEGDSWIALVDVKAPDADAAVKRAWAAYKPDAKWPLKLTTDAPPKDGWTNRRNYEYQTSPNERRDVGVSTLRANDTWTVVIYDVSQPVGEKRGAQISLIFSRLLPKGFARESFAGKRANDLDVTRIAELSKFIEAGQKTLGVPGVSLGIIQNGKVVFTGGFGVKELGKPGKPDGNTMYMIASNTKGLTTLLLAKLVEAKQLTWETPATTLLPTFKLGDEATTKSVLVKHLICACTGLPRQDLEWLFEFKKNTAEDTMRVLGTMQPTTKFGEMFQYSNPLAAAAGFIAGHVAYPKLELGAAYDKAMQTYVFDPLGMKATTFDYARAQKTNAARPHGPTVDGKTALAAMDLNYSIIAARPAGAGWSNVNDMLKYVQMELAEGALPGGKQYIDKATLLTRRAPQVPIGKDMTYGMGLMVSTKYGTPVVQHGGAMLGFHSQMWWLPEHGVGAVLLTNSETGYQLHQQFGRKLLEVLFDGKPEADADLANTGKTYWEQLATERKLLTIPPDPAEVAKLAPKYKNAVLGELVVKKTDAGLVFDVGEWHTTVASKQHPDGSVSFVTTSPGYMGFEFVAADKKLTVRDAQHEYVFESQ